MADNENLVKRQVKDKIKSFNRSKAGMVIAIILFIGILFFSLATGTDTLSVVLLVFCSAVLLLCCAAFVLSSRSLLFLFFAAASITGITLGLNLIRFELFLIFFLINAGTVFISNKTSIATIRSFTDEIETITRLKAEATTDCLTQLLNRSGLEQSAGTAWALCKRNKQTVGVILADVDYFKSYNDALGHFEGDNILKQVADNIKICFRREADIISRIGGDEFLIFLSDTGDDHVLEMAQSLSLAITNLKVKTDTGNDPCGFLSVSIGIATSVPQPDELPIDLYKTADKALYHAKKAGRNCISFQGKIIQRKPSTDESSPVGVLATSVVCRNNED